MWDKLALILLIIGGVNWGLVGVFEFDLVAWIFGGSASPEFYAQDIMTKRPEQLSVQQFVELTNMVAEEAEKIGKTL